MFLGEFQHSVDPKGRVILPSKFRAALKEGLVVTKGLEECLFVYPQSEWQKMEENVRGLPTTRKDARAFARSFFAGAIGSKLDRLGRVFIPQNLRDFAHLTKDVVVIGVSARIEIWDKVRWNRYQKETDKAYTDIAEKLTDLGI
ncbi:MAG: division/cell wall cluster transcriptional repressor MraZ [Actinomycetota bacterium]